MFSSYGKVAIAASWLFWRISFAEAAPNPVAMEPDRVVKRQMIETPSTIPNMRALTELGCFSIAEPMEDHGPYNHQSKGNCQPICWLLGKSVMGIVNGTNCFCGDMAPPLNSKVDDSECSTPCGGIATEFCGGNNKFTVYNTGFSLNAVEYLDPAKLSSAAASTSTPTAEPTIVVTASSTPSAQSSGGGSSKVGIAVGVVVGVIAIIGIIGGVLFFLRYKKRRDAEEEYKRQAAVNAFVNGGKGHNSASSINDSRLDPELLQYNRRESTGTIADNQDYSRKILKVRNPDDF